MRLACSRSGSTELNGIVAEKRETRNDAFHLDANPSLHFPAPNLRFVVLAINPRLRPSSPLPLVCAATIVTIQPYVNIETIAASSLDFQDGASRVQGACELREAAELVNPSNFRSSIPV